MERPINQTPQPYFRPALPEGCVAKDRHMARALLGCYQGELYAIAAYLYRSLLTEHGDRTLSELFEMLAKEEIEQFRLVGELITALGERPILRTQVRIEESAACKEHTIRRTRLLEESLHEEKCMIERYQTLMASTEDRVVRSILSHLLSDGHRHAERLREAVC